MTVIKKPLLIVLIFAVIVGGSIAFYTSTQLDGQIAQEIEKQGSAALGTQVKVVGVETSLRDATAKVLGLSVKNPSGYTQENALELGSFIAKVDYASREIEELVIDKPTINAELLDGESNFQQLLRNVPDAEELEDSASADESSSIITIRKFLLSNAVLNLTANDTEMEPQSFVMADLVVNNLSGTSEQIATELGRRLSQHVSRQIKSRAINMVRERAEQAFKSEAGKLGEKLRNKLRDRLNIEKPSEDP